MQAYEGTCQHCNEKDIFMEMNNEGCHTVTELHDRTRKELEQQTKLNVKVLKLNYTAGFHLKAK